MAGLVSPCNLHVTFKCTPSQHWDILGRFSDRGSPGTYQVIILGFRNRGSRNQGSAEAERSKVVSPYPIFYEKASGNWID
jgi:hypothetical protein